jgi:hypothetical protein
MVFSVNPSDGSETLFVGGQTKSGMFTGVSGIYQAMAASYSLETHTYNWVRVF